MRESDIDRNRGEWWIYKEKNKWEGCAGDGEKNDKRSWKKRRYQRDFPVCAFLLNDKWWHITKWWLVG